MAPPRPAWENSANCSATCCGVPISSTAPAGDEALLELLDLGAEGRALDAEDDDLRSGPVAGVDDRLVRRACLLLRLPADDQQ